MTNALLLTACLAGGLQSGAYYVLTCGVMPGLAPTDDATFVGAMQGVNNGLDAAGPVTGEDGVLAARGSRH